ncbi:MAG TPA: thioredoxin [Actinobacteria bacterium]|nr:thioredoxin [Actinomycetota bacterium]
MKLDDLRRPTIVEVVTPTCGACRAMASDLEAVAAEFDGRVDLAVVDAAAHPEVAAELGVRGTPTLIGVRDGAERFRTVGRRTRRELRELFVALAADERPGRVGHLDLLLRVGAGASLVVMGIVLGAVPVAVVGVAAVVVGAVAWWRGPR